MEYKKHKSLLFLLLVIKTPTPSTNGCEAKKNKKYAIISAKIQRQMMTYTLTLQSDDKSLLRSFKALAREFGAKLEIKEQKCIKALDDAIAEFESGQTEKFESFDDFAKEMRAL